MHLPESDIEACQQWIERLEAKERFLQHDIQEIRNLISGFHTICSEDGTEIDGTELTLDRRNELKANLIAAAAEIAPTQEPDQ